MPKCSHVYSETYSNAFRIRFGHFTGILYANIDAVEAGFLKNAANCRFFAEFFNFNGKFHSPE